MQSLIRFVLEAGRSSVDLTLYVLLPVMVLMMAVMRLLEAKGVLGFVSRLLTPVLRPFGIPGAGVFAMLQVLFVSFAAPATTLAIMDKQASRRGLAATLAMVFAMSQANAVFPLLSVGLNLPVVLFTSLVGGLAAAAITYHVFARNEDDEARPPAEVEGDDAGAPAVVAERPARRTRVSRLLADGGEEGISLSLRSLPMLLLAICVVKALEAAGAIALAERGLQPLLAFLGLSKAAVLPFATKYLAGGTAMMGVMIDLVRKGAMSAGDLNRVAGFMINPLDFVGLAILIPADSQAEKVAGRALAGAAVGIVIRGLLHLAFF